MSLQPKLWGSVEEEEEVKGRCGERCLFRVSIRNRAVRRTFREEAMKRARSLTNHTEVMEGAENRD